MQYKHILQIALLALIVVPTASCKKEVPKVATAEPQTIPSESVASQAQPQAMDQSDPCFPYRDNPLFQDKHVFKYALNLANEAYDIDAEDFECDDSGHCRREITVDMTCTATRTGKDVGYCASKLECKTDPGQYKSDIPDFIEGYWFRDENGFYLQNEVFYIKKENGDCSETQYIDCKAGTLAHDFASFSDVVPTIPTLKQGSINENDYFEDSDTSRSWDVTLDDNAWCSTHTISGSDYSSSQICISDTKGIVSFQDSFSGGSDRDTSGDLVE